MAKRLSQKQGEGLGAGFARPQNLRPLEFWYGHEGTVMTKPSSYYLPAYGMMCITHLARNATVSSSVHVTPTRAAWIARGGDKQTRTACLPLRQTRRDIAQLPPFSCGLMERWNLSGCRNLLFGHATLREA